MTSEICVRKIDNRSTVFATNTHVFDVPIIREKEFDYDDLVGVIDDRDNPDDKTMPLTVKILHESIVSYLKDHK